MVFLVRCDGAKSVVTRHIQSHENRPRGKGDGKINAKEEKGAKSAVKRRADKAEIKRVSEALRVQAKAPLDRFGEETTTLVSQRGECKSPLSIFSNYHNNSSSVPTNQPTTLVVVN